MHPCRILFENRQSSGSAIHNRSADNSACAYRSRSLQRCIAGLHQRLKNKYRSARFPAPSRLLP